MGLFAKPIKIVRVTHGYNVFVKDVPVVPEGRWVSFDKRRAGLRVPDHYVPPTKGKRPILIRKKDDAIRVVHQIGRYLLGLGDFVSGYVELVGVPGSHEAWWNRKR